MRMIQPTRSMVFALGLIISLLCMNTASDLDAQSPTAQTLIDRLLSTEKRKLRYLPRAKLAREIANDRNLSPKVRVDVLTAVLREELENPCPGETRGDGHYGPPTVHLQGQ